MSVYMIIQLEVQDKEAYGKYTEEAGQIIKKYGGRRLVASDKVFSLKGDWKPQRVVILEFEDMIKLRRCFKSEEYAKIAPLRENSTVSKSIIVEGTKDPERA